MLLIDFSNDRNLSFARFDPHYKEAAQHNLRGRDAATVVELTTGNWQLTYIPGSFIPASRRAKLGLPICLNIFFICAYWRSRLFTS